MAGNVRAGMGAFTGVRVLGPIEVWSRNERLVLGGPRQLALLALLVVHANQVVSNDRLVDAVWSDGPGDARKRLQMAVSRLRQTLQPLEADGEPLLRTVSGGYLLSLAPERLDAQLLQQRVRDGERALADGDVLGAREAIGTALALWRGPPFAEVTFADFAQGEVRRLEELRLRALEVRIDADLRLSRHAALIEELQALVVAEPTREHLVGCLMLALYRCGRQVDALEVYRRIRVQLVRDLGLEPGPALKALESQILAQAPELEVHGSADPDAGRATAGARGSAAPSNSSTESDRDVRPVGRRRPVQRVLPRAIHVARSGPCLGRGEELSRLLGHWKHVADDGRATVVIGGEAGVGKTRLTAELAQIAHDAGALTLYGRCDEGLAVPYQPFVEALRPYLEAVGAAGLGEQLGWHASILARLWPELGTAADRIFIDADAERMTLFDAVATLLEAASHETPIVLILDDLHWAPRPTLLLIRHLVRSERQIRALMVLTYRREEAGPSSELAGVVADLSRDPSAESVTLSGIGSSATAELVANASGGVVDDRVRELADVLVRETAGNPLFVTELIAHLRETGAIASFVPGSATPRFELPPGLRQVIVHRASRLSEPAQAALSVGAVAGPTFSLALLERVLADEPLVLDSIDEALTAGLLFDLDQGELAFAHVLVQHALYEGLSSARRVRLHHRIGEVLEGGGEAAPIESLAYHFWHAAPDGQAAKAVRYSLQAAQSAMRRLGFEEAALHCERGLGVVDRLAASGDERRAELLIALAEARWGAGEVERAQQAAALAAELADQLAQAPLLVRSALSFAGPISLAINDEAVQPTIDLLERALSATSGDDAITAERARLMARLSTAIVPGTDDDRRVALADRALEMAREVGDPPTLAYVLGMHHWVVRAPDNVDEQLAIVSEILAVASAIDDRRQELEARVWKLDHHLELGDADAVQRELAVLERLGNHVRDRRSRWILVNTWARRAHMAGELAEFETLATEAMAYSVEGQDQSGTQIFGGQMVALRREQRRLGEVVGPIEAFVDQFPAVSVWRSTLAYVYGEQERRADAQEQIEVLARTGLASLPRDGFWMSSMAMLGEVVAFLVDRNRAIDLYDSLLPFDGRVVVISGVLCQGALARSLGVLATTIGDYGSAERHLDAALTLNSHLGATLWATYTRYNQATLLLTRGDEDDLDRAFALLDEVLVTSAQLGLAALAARATRTKVNALSASAQPVAELGTL